MGSNRDGRHVDWDAVFDVLVEELGVSEPLRGPFVQQHSGERCPEWRIGGRLLGFAGKLWDDGTPGGLRVGYGSDTPSEEKDAAVARANARIAALAAGRGAS